MVVMDIQEINVNKDVNNSYISHFKMVMGKLDNVSVKMTYPLQLDMEQLHVV